MTLCTIWYHLYNLIKNVKNTYGCFTRFLNDTNGTKSREVSKMHYHSSVGFFTSNVLNNALHKTSAVGKTLAGVDINCINEN